MGPRGGLDGFFRRGNSLHLPGIPNADRQALSERYTGSQTGLEE
jgi:hypothetical protein